MGKEVVLFGAGIYAEKYRTLLEYLGMPFQYLSDNDSSKIGLEIWGRKIIPPYDLINKKCNIIISCTHKKAIEQQLVDMGIADKLLRIEDLAKELQGKFKKDKICISARIPEKQSIILDMYEGDGWGGTEMWAATVAKGLREKGKEVILFGSELQPPLNEEYEYMVERFPDLHTFEKIVKSMVSKLPFALINNFAGYAYMAAVMLKILYPDKVKIISVIHNDDGSLYNAHMVYADYVDKFLCVSDRIRMKIIQEYGLDEKKVFFKEQPILCDENYKRSYNLAWRPIRIGYAARIVKMQKRADLFPELINYLEREKINYELCIAGDGECVSQIKDFLQSTTLMGTVKMIGRLQKKNMPDFWKQQDIFLNFSEFEGTSLSMLEAMSYACVPVVTNVSGVSEFIQDGRNGYVREVGDLMGLVSAIKCLEVDRNKLEIFGERCRQEILMRCRIKDYSQFICDTISGA